MSASDGPLWKKVDIDSHHVQGGVGTGFERPVFWPLRVRRARSLPLPPGGGK
ncbi:hypothetical protein KI387_013490, partial [Taxus chinensis]